jgi:hypothetical protein
MTLSDLSLVDGCKSLGLQDMLQPDNGDFKTAKRIMMKQKTYIDRLQKLISDEITRKIRAELIIKTGAAMLLLQLQETAKDLTPMMLEISDMMSRLTCRPGQENEVRNLADYLYEKCQTSHHWENIAMMAPLAKWTTKGRIYQDSYQRVPMPGPN